MKGKRILVGIMAISLGLGMAGSALAQRGGGQGGSSMMQRDGMGGASSMGTRERSRDMVQDHRQVGDRQQMERQSRHESAQRQGEPGGNEGSRDRQQAETREQHMERSRLMEQPQGEAHRGPSEQANRAAHEAVAHHGEGTGTAAAVHAVNPSQSTVEERKEVEVGQ